jgi:murein DD-endopeptidase MepM/ murein hydrolase activator NlpD
VARIKYFYNDARLRFEKVEVRPWQLALRIFGFVSAVLVFSAVVVGLAYTYIDSPKEKQLLREIEQMSLQYELLQQRTELTEQALKELEQRDDQIYRVIFEAEPLPASVRSGSRSAAEQSSIMSRNQTRLIEETTERVQNLGRRLYLQSKSYDELARMAGDKKKLLAAIPAIQPVSNKKLTAIASGFGYRIDPIYKTLKMHEGVDFTAPTSTAVYATGEGRVEKLLRMDRGYGNAVIIDHGFGYQTLYAHLSAFAVRPGQRISRGTLIGKVGNTGKSTGPHLHYEVIKDGRKVNPIYFFHDDISPDQFERLIQISGTLNQSFD